MPDLKINISASGDTSAFKTVAADIRGVETASKTAAPGVASVSKGVAEAGTSAKAAAIPTEKLGQIFGGLARSGSGGKESIIGLANAFRGLFSILSTGGGIGIALAGIAALGGIVLALKDKFKSVEPSAEELAKKFEAALAAGASVAKIEFTNLVTGLGNVSAALVDEVARLKEVAAANTEIATTWDNVAKAEVAAKVSVGKMTKEAGAMATAGIEAGAARRPGDTQRQLLVGEISATEKAQGAISGTLKQKESALIFELNRLNELQEKWAKLQVAPATLRGVLETAGAGTMSTDSAAMAKKNEEYLALKRLAAEKEQVDKEGPASARAKEMEAQRKAVEVARESFTAVATENEQYTKRIRTLKESLSTRVDVGVAEVQAANQIAGLKEKYKPRTANEESAFGLEAEKLRRAGSAAVSERIASGMPIDPALLEEAFPGRKFAAPERGGASSGKGIVKLGGGELPDSESTQKAIEQGAIKIEKAKAEPVDMKPMVDATTKKLDELKAATDAAVVGVAQSVSAVATELTGAKQEIRTLRNQILNMQSR